MVLTMARPWRHPKTGIFWFRRAVPPRLRSQIGKREEKRSLGTRDPILARHRHMEVAAEVNRQWGALERGPVEISHKTMFALAGEFYRTQIKVHEENPGNVIERERDVKNKRERLAFPLMNADGRTVAGAGYLMPARKFLLKKGYVLHYTDVVKFLNLLARVDLLASEHLLKNAQGDYSPDPNAARFPSLESVSESKKVLLWPSWEKYQGSLAPSTRKRWRSVMRRVEARFGSDLMKIDRDKVIAWRDDRLNEINPRTREKINPTTVKEGDIAALHWLLERLVNDNKLSINAASNVEVLTKTAPRGREKGFTESEATRILSATLAPPSHLMSEVNAAVRRWVPWMCAYTGARVNEVTQARFCDVSLDPKHQIWVLRITPEAGSTKNGNYRDVPLHPHLVEQGLIDYVMTRKGKPLFFDEARNRNRSEENPYYKKQGERLAEWVRSQVGIKDKRVKPNHGWRHRFTSVSRGRMHSDVVDVIQGHAPRREAQNYGDTWIEVAYAEICKHPRYDVEALGLSSQEATRRPAKVRFARRQRRKGRGQVNRSSAVEGVGAGLRQN